MSTIYTISAQDLERLKLFMYELNRLLEDMAVAQNPHAERLEGLLERFTADTVLDRMPRHG